MTARVAIYPGTFDPITFGHLDIVRRGSVLFDQLIIGVSRSANKSPIFSLEKRVEMVESLTAEWDNVTTAPFSGLLVDFAQQQKASVILRGLRAVSDFEFEIQMAAFNRQLDERVETLFLSPDTAYSFLSSTMVRDVARHGGDTTAFVPPLVSEALKAHFS